jgi:ribosomal 50S subunit-recycling heat shock protein
LFVLGYLADTLNSKERDLMRLDKFLKMTRLIKRRSLANELCDLGGVCLNAKVAKASHTVKVGDDLELRFGNKMVKARVLEIPFRPAGNLTVAAQYVDIYHQERLETALPYPLDEEDMA